MLPSRDGRHIGRCADSEISTSGIHKEIQPFQVLNATRAKESVDTRIFQLDTGLTGNRVEFPPMKSRAQIAEHVRAFRQRQSAAGNREVTLNLPRDAVAFLDEIKERQGLRNRSQALLQLIEQKGAPAQQMN